MPEIRGTVVYKYKHIHITMARNKQVQCFYHVHGWTVAVSIMPPSQAQRDREPSSAMKMAFGCLISAASFLFMVSPAVGSRNVFPCYVKCHAGDPA